MNIIDHIKGRLQGKIPAGKARSNKWPKIRAAHLKLFPKCSICSGTKKIEVHHIKPFHLHPELELDPNNLISLCEAKKNGVNCHLLFGHLGNFESLNTGITQDALIWNIKITHRP